MPLSMLANAIYQVLRQRVPGRHADIPYRQLVEQLPPLARPYQDLHWRDPRLDEALGEIVTACRAAQLPALSAIVVNAETGRPGRQYYPLAHPGVRDEVEQEVLWAREREQVLVTGYPPAL